MGKRKDTGSESRATGQEKPLSVLAPVKWPGGRWAQNPRGTLSLDIQSKYLHTPPPQTPTEGLHSAREAEIDSPARGLRKGRAGCAQLPGGEVRVPPGAGSKAAAGPAFRSSFFMSDDYSSFPSPEASKNESFPPLMH